MKKCFFIAPLEVHATSGRLAMLIASGLEVHVIDISYSPPKFKMNVYPFSEIKSYRYCNLSKISVASAGRIMQLLVHRFGFFSPKLFWKNRIRYFSAELDRVKPDLVVTFYGPLGIFFARIIRLVNKNIPLVSILNLIPSSLDYPKNLKGWIGEFLNPELNNYKKTIAQINLIVCASSDMQLYLNKQYHLPLEMTTVLPDYFHKTLAANAEIDCDVALPSVIFLGAPERWGGKLDGMDDQFLELTKAGINVHSGQMSKKVLESTRGYVYTYFSEDEIFSGAYSRFISKYPIAIITYAIEQRHQRFLSTLPTRFFSAISAGLPIAVRSGLFDAVEDYVRRYGIGFAFKDAEDLKEKLLNKDQLLKYRANAHDHSRKFYAEAQANEFLKTINLTLFNFKDI